MGKIITEPVCDIVENLLNGFYKEIEKGDYESAFKEWGKIRDYLFGLTDILYDYNIKQGIPNSSERFRKYMGDKHGRC